MAEGCRLLSAVITCSQVDCADGHTQAQLITENILKITQVYTSNGCYVNYVSINVFKKRRKETA